MSNMLKWPPSRDGVTDRWSEIEEVAQPGAYCSQTVGRDFAGYYPRKSIPRQRARLLGHDPRWPVQPARPLHANVVRPSAVGGRDRQHDDEGRHGIQVTRGRNDENRAMTTLLSAADRLECRPGYDTRGEVGGRHEASASSVRSQSSVSAEYDPASSGRRVDRGLQQLETPSSVLGICEMREVRPEREPVTGGLLLEPVAEFVADFDGRSHTPSIPTSEKAHVPG